MKDKDKGWYFYDFNRGDMDAKISDTYAGCIEVAITDAQSYTHRVHLSEEEVKRLIKYLQNAVKEL